MVTLIIRDDDINYFTPEWVLEKIYEKCWHNNIPICFSVIPHLLSQKKYKLNYHPFIPEEFTLLNQNFNIGRNRKLCQYLNDKAKNNLAELCLHGFDHSLIGGVPEFSIKNKTKIRKKIVTGKSNLKEAIPNATIRTFIPPFNKISKKSLEIIIDEGMNLALNISVKNFIFSQIVPIESQFSLLKNILCGLRQAESIKIKYSKIFFHRGYWLKHSYHKHINYNGYNLLIKELEQKTDKDKLFVVVNHHWEFFDRGYKHDTHLFKQWNEFLVKLLLYKENICFTTFEKCKI